MAQLRPPGAFVELVTADPRMRLAAAVPPDGAQRNQAIGIADFGAARLRDFSMTRRSF
jgi:hypothetical protein